MSARARMYSLLAAMGALLLIGLLFVTAGSAAAAPVAVPGNGNGNGHGNHGQGNQGQEQENEQNDEQGTNGGNGRAVVWAKRQITATLAAGASLDVTVNFTVTRALTDVQVSLVPAGRAGVVSVTPTTFASLVPGQTYSVRVHLQVPTGVRRGAYNANLFLKHGHRKYAQPLGVHIKVQRPNSP